MGIKEEFVGLNLQNEQKWLAYCFYYPEEAFSIDVNKVLNIDIKKVLTSIQECYNKDLVVTVDEVYNFYKQNSGLKERGDLVLLKNSFTDFSNIDFIKETINNHYINTEANSKILEDILVETDRVDGLNKDKLKELAENLLDNINLTDNKKRLMTGLDISEKYNSIIDKRKSGIVKRSFGFAELDRVALRPASPGEMTSLVALKGSAKSIFTKSIENRLINSGVPVLSLNLEMGFESTFDRFMAMRGGIPLADLMDKDKILQARFESTVRRTMSMMADNPYFLYSDEPSLSISDIQYLVREAKKKFRKAGVLGSDDYIFVTIDLLEMVNEFSGAKAEGIKEAIDKFNIVCKSENIHFFNVLQANENKIRRERRFETPEALDRYTIGLEDIYGGDGYAGRSRLVMSLQRPKHLRKHFFPQRKEEWDLEPDIMYCHFIKQNDGDLAYTKFVFVPEVMSIMPYKVQ